MELSLASFDSISEVNMVRYSLYELPHPVTYIARTKINDISVEVKGHGEKSLNLITFRGHILLAQ